MACTVWAVSLGCNKNRVDTETALGLLAEKGFLLADGPEDAEIILVNTCGFIDPAKEESINTILDMAEYKKTGRCRLLAVTGCLSQRYSGDLLKELPEIDLLMGVNQYRELPAAIEKALGAERPCLCGDDFGYYEHDRVLTTPPYSAYVRIGEGCSNRCTFCAIPMIRGPYRSRKEEAVLGEIRSLAARGVREHILVAQDTTRFGTEDHPHTTLPDLMRKAAAIDGVDWLRVLYCYPDETNEALLDRPRRQGAGADPAHDADRRLPGGNGRPVPGTAGLCGGNGVRPARRLRLLPGGGNARGENARPAA